MKKIIAYTLKLFITIAFLSCQSNDDFEAKKTVAKEILSKDCDFIVDATTEFIKKKHPFTW